jgi:activating signal cointegrator 1
MKALSLWQPWASLVALGIKTIETRSWETKYRGPLAIHAAKKRPHNVWTDDNQNLGGSDPLTNMIADRVDCEHLFDISEASNDPGYFCHRWRGPLGAVVATCELLYCAPVLTYCSSSVCVVPGAGALWLYNPGTGRGADITGQRPYGDFSLGRFAWVLTDIKPVDPPVPAKGHQQLWEVTL